ncbi:serine/threonine-protein kinase-10 [Elsinoe australis]|uniref:Serine/threonine-protein kinase-10 n=1 Tax=Elsinoe australis TaxID=40998 RepID=A0A4U7B374_9PEZI|nr:serine/threonine-protein kinase-10 [Elsinoe australis]
MAQEDYDWQRLRVDTSSRNSSQYPSRSGSYDGQIIYGSDATGLESGGLNIKSNDNIPPFELNASWCAGDDRSRYLSPEGATDDAHHSRPRNHSISFDPEAKLENGDRHALEQPLPRTGSLRSVTSLGRPNGGRKMIPSAPLQFDSSTCKINPFTGEPVRRRPRRQNTGSTGMSIMDAFNQTPGPEGDQLASLTSESTASPPHDEVATPTSPPGSYIDSPTAVSSPAFSPALESEPWPACRTGSIRSARTLPSRPISLRRESRRSSRRATSSTSFSPGSAASAYLAKWGRDSMTAAAPEPDDEGQSFGMDGEYVIGRQIGYGGFSVVKEAFSISEDGEKRKHAVKIVRKNIREKPEAENEKCQQELEHEVGIWKYLNHEHVLSLYSDYETDFARFCVMDLSEGGSLYDLVRDSRKSGKALPAALVKSYVFQLASALRYLHEDVRVVHRDVKMENCLIDKDRASLGDEPGRLRLCDFGLADFISTDSPDVEEADGSSSPAKASNIVGSLEYAAPEALRTEQAVLSPTVDIWALGVCIYTMLTNDRPFKHSLAHKVIELIEAASWDEEAVRNSLAAAGHEETILELLGGCMQPDMNLRWNIGQVLASPWFADCDDPYAS